MALEGGPVTTFGVAASIYSPGITLAVDDRYVYWANMESGDVSAVPIAGGPARLVASGQVGVLTLAASGGFVVWSIQDGGTDWVVRSAPRDGGGQLELARQTVPVADMTADATHAYWTSSFPFPNGPPGGSLSRAPLDGSAAAEPIVSEAAYPGAIAVDDAFVYWADGLKRMRIEKPAP